MSSDSCELLCVDLPQAEKVRARVPGDDDVRPAADRARALADPTRLRIARALQIGGELCVCDLAWVCSSSQNLVSHHARQLRTAGLTASRRDGKLVMYRLTDAGHALLSLLLPDPGLEPAVREG
ncbi:metalloregulator ArsR/SmtB family transcription factor [Nocardiopsis sp. FIRDI 009]|uniref:ArsR/SmtB family transcription factor n=1 Tax=Nocardiopsis sp. FIRDI 009 TaxID=714197 RepID=UPI000E23F138|nr:metalloregulator ArsR/SmtB family transcription factor [Nocardiopsis sp. FIRDI 009]